MPRENRFRNSCYKACLRRLHEVYRGDPSQAEVSALVEIVARTPLEWWQSGGFRHPNAREIKMSAEVFKACVAACRG